MKTMIANRINRSFFNFRCLYSFFCEFDKLNKIIFYFVLFLILHAELNGQVKISPFYYKDYLIQKREKGKIFDLIKREKYQEALYLSDSIMCQGLACKDKYELIALCYLGLGIEEECKDYLLRAIERGLDINKLGYNFIGKEWPISNAERDKAFNVYINSIDLELRKSLSTTNNQDFELTYLDSIIKNRGWPGVSKIGFQTYCDPILPTKNLFLRLSYLSNFELSKYIDLIINECESYDEEWGELEFLLKHNIEKHLLKKKKYIELDFVYFDQSNGIDMQKSLPQLNVLALYVKQNFNRLVLYRTTKLSNSNSFYLLNQIQVELINLGLSQNDVLCSTELIDDLNCSNEVFFCFSIIN